MTVPVMLMPALSATPVAGSGFTAFSVPDVCAILPTTVNAAVGATGSALTKPSDARTIAAASTSSSAFGDMLVAVMSFIWQEPYVFTSVTVPERTL